MLGVGVHQGEGGGSLCKVGGRRLMHRKRCPVSRFWPQPDRSPWGPDRDLSAPDFRARFPLLSPVSSTGPLWLRLHSSE